MRILIVDDDFVSRKLIQGILSPYGACDIAVDGAEAILAFGLAMEEKDPYRLICLDIMMPGVDGQQALKEIRELEKKNGIEAADEVRIIMTTALEEPRNVFEAYFAGKADAYILKPITRAKLIGEVRKLGLV